LPTAVDCGELTGQLVPAWARLSQPYWQTLVFTGIVFKLFVKTLSHFFYFFFKNKVKIASIRPPFTGMNLGLNPVRLHGMRINPLDWL
jgi:hypothetical protein